MNKEKSYLDLEAESPGSGAPLMRVWVDDITGLDMGQGGS